MRLGRGRGEFDGQEPPLEMSLHLVRVGRGGRGRGREGDAELRGHHIREEDSLHGERGQRWQWRLSTLLSCATSS